MYKFVKDTNKTIEQELPDLKKNFPGFYFKSGKYKDKDVIFILNDLTTREYLSPQDSVEFPGFLFFGPKHIENKQEFLNSKKVVPEIDERKIKVKLPNGIDLVIFPASLEPKKVILSLTAVKTKTSDNPYGDSEYGKLAYEVYAFAKEKKEVGFCDPRVIRLICLALKRSYNIPVDVWNSLELIGEESLDPILCAALGINFDEVLKKN